jgi:hypothetical protein
VKAIIYSTYYLSPHFETDLELISRLIEQKVDVYVVRCYGELETCLVNPEHDKNICKSCIRTYNKGLRLSELPRGKIIILRNTGDIEDAEIPKRFSNLEELKSYTVDNSNFGLAVFGTLVSRLEKNHKFDTLEKSIEVDRELRVSLKIYYSFLKIIGQIKPDYVYLFNGRFSTHRPVIRACEKTGTPFYTHERAGESGKFTLVQNALVNEIEPMKRDILRLWKYANEDKYQIAQRFYEERRGNFEQGWMSFTRKQEIGQLPSDFNKHKINIGVFNSTIEEYESFECWRNPIYIDEIDGLRRLFESFKENNEMHFFLRIHPNLAGYNNAQMKEIRKFAQYLNVTLIGPESKVHTYSLLDDCDYILTYGSTVGVEACFWGKPSILCARAIYEDLDCCYVPKSHNELIDLIQKKPKPKNREGAMIYGYWELMRGEKFKYFEASGLFSGKFKGQDLQPKKMRYALAENAILKGVRRFKKVIGLK